MIKNMTVKRSGLVIAILLALPVISMAQGMGQSQGMGSGSGQMGTPPNQAQPAQQNTPSAAAPALDAKEEDAYKKLSSMQTAKAEDLARSGESFVKTFPKSNHLETVYSMLAEAYMQLGNDADMFKYGSLTLKMNPNNVDGLAVMSVATARKIDPDNHPDAMAKEKQVEDWSGRCITSLQSLTKPDGVTDADFARSRDGKLAMCYSGLGQTDLFEGKVGEAVKALSKATQLEGSTPDPVDLFLLGMALMDNKQGPEAVTAFQQCIKDTDQRMVPLCTEQLGNAKKMGK
jgi:lipopolysaccharide biosynthesis regulator YciM